MSSSTIPPTQYLKVSGGQIGYDDTAGSGPLVIAAPGMGDLRQEYRLLRQQLVAAGYRVVTLDVRGHGDSSVEWSDYSAHAVGTDMLALLDHLKVEKAVFVGNSFSCGSVLWALKDAPSKVSAAILTGPIVRDPPGCIPWYIRATLKLGFGGPWRTGFWMMYWTSLFPTKQPADLPQYKQKLRANLQQPGRMQALQAMLGLSKADTEAIITASKVPALIVMGTKDPDFSDPAVESKWLLGKLGSQAQELLVQGAGHYPHTEMPDEVGPAVVNFLKQHQR